MEPSLFGDYPPQFAAFDKTTAADHQVVAAVVGHYFRVVSYTLSNAGAALNVVEFESDATTLGHIALGVGESVHAYNLIGLFETAPGEDLDITLSAAERVVGHLTYILVKSHNRVSATDLA